MSLKMASILSQSYRNSSNVMHFGKIYFDPLRVSLGPWGCIYDNKTIKLSYHVHNLLDFNRNQTVFLHLSYIPGKCIYKHSVKLLLALCIFSFRSNVFVFA